MNDHNNFPLTNSAYCVEYLYAKEGCRDQLTESLLRLVKPTRAEPGCLQYDLIQDNENPNLIILIVKFENENLMRQHENKNYVKAFAENEMKKYCEKLVWHDGIEISK